jgi:hypothetical protein
VRLIDVIASIEIGFTGEKIINYVPTRDSQALCTTCRYKGLAFEFLGTEFDGIAKVSGWSRKRWLVFSEDENGDREYHELDKNEIGVALPDVSQSQGEIKIQIPCRFIFTEGGVKIIEIKKQNVTAGVTQ